MKELLVAVGATLLFPFLAAGCSSVGPATSRDYDMKDFTKVRISGAFQMELVQSGSYAVTVTAQEGLFNRIKVAVSGDTLEVGIENTWLPPWGFQRPKVKISMPDLYSVDLSGASRGTAKGFQSAHDTDVVLSGASSLELDVQAASAGVDVSGASHLSGQLKISQVRIKVNGASRADLSGSGDSLDLEASGASNAGMESFSAKDVSVDISGASRGTVSASGTLKVVLSGASSLTYSGNPTLGSVDVSGASTIHKK